MNIINEVEKKSERYLPHEINTKYYAVISYRNGNKATYVCRKYHISKASLSRWNRKFDGNKESLVDKSHKPLTPHPNAHTELEKKWMELIECYTNHSISYNIGEEAGKCNQQLNIHLPLSRKVPTS